mmetsp:Transcript_64773/g.189975  ORF Transcript_64773/g.189975 Transcript_64773/m.189975 type:complete len:113 (+) Transcript_64773:1072-1410(+)
MRSGRAILSSTLCAKLQLLPLLQRPFAKNLQGVVLKSAFFTRSFDVLFTLSFDVVRESWAGQGPLDVAPRSSPIGLALGTGGAKSCPPFGLGGLSCSVDSISDGVKSEELRV